MKIDPQGGSFPIMQNNRLILIIAISFSLLVNIPRIVFLFGEGNNDLGGFFEVSSRDTVFRIVSLFGFCFLILKLNIDWAGKSLVKSGFLKVVLISIGITLIWLVLFRIFDTLVNRDNSSTLYPGFNGFVYFFVLITLLVISRTVLLNQRIKEDAIEKERLKRQSLQNELSALRNQVNPHFLFNSLNSLSLLVRQDPDAANKFIGKLSFLYRYILQSKDQDLVTVKEELRFLESYAYLIKQRYHAAFEVEIKLKEELHQKQIPSLALQLLTENAVKHNEISERNPLIVYIYMEEGSLVVKNKLQPRNDNVESTNTGLSNLNTRFRLLLKKEITIMKSDGNFLVKLPIA